MKQLDIDNGVEADIVGDIDSPRLSSIAVEFQVKGEHTRQAFFLPGEIDWLVAFLFDKSMTLTVDHGFKIMMNTAPLVLRGYSFYLVPSKDGQTNINSNLIDTFMRFK